MSNKDSADLTQAAFLKPGEVARLWQVDPKTVARWAKTNKVTYIWTPGGHRLYHRAQFDHLLNGSGNGQTGGK